MPTFPMGTKPLISCLIVTVFKGKQPSNAHFFHVPPSETAKKGYIQNKIVYLIIPEKYGISLNMPYKVQ